MFVCVDVLGSNENQLDHRGETNMQPYSQPGDGDACCAAYEHITIYLLLFTHFLREEHTRLLHVEKKIIVPANCSILVLCPCPNNGKRTTTRKPPSCNSRERLLKPYQC